MALLLLPKGRLCVSGQKQMCHLCGWLKLFLKNVRWGKIKIQKRWLSGRLSDCSFVQSLYVYFCLSFLLCRFLGLQVTIPYTHRISLTLALWVGTKSCDEPSNPREIEKWIKLGHGGYIIILNVCKVCFIVILLGSSNI